MQIYISSFYNVRFFTPNIIPISTAASFGWPWWLVQADKHKQGELYLNSNNVMIGIKEEKLAFPTHLFDNLTEQCQKECPYKEKAPHCQFMDSYYNYLKTLDFESIVTDFERVANDVKKINRFETEPIIVLMVYESPNNPCGERPCLQQWFADNGYELREWTKDLIGDIFERKVKMDKIVKDTIKELYQKNNFTYDETKDLYSNYAAQLYNIPYEDCQEMKDEKYNPEGKKRRQEAKFFILAAVEEKLKTL